MAVKKMHNSIKVGDTLQVESKLIPNLDRSTPVGVQLYLEVFCQVIESKDGTFVLRVDEVIRT